MPLLRVAATAFGKGRCQSSTPFWASVGFLLAVFGWAAWVRGPLTLLEALAVLVLLDIKSRREEAWLLARFPAYADYRRRVRKLIPFIY